MLALEKSALFLEIRETSSLYIHQEKNFIAVVEKVKIAEAFLADERASLQKTREPICADSSHKSDIGESAER